MADHRKERFLFLLGKFGHTEPADSGDCVVLEQVFRAVDQDPELFLKEWLRPLLAEGLDLDQAFEVALESVLRPN
jgi:hypothetical protein